MLRGLPYRMSARKREGGSKNAPNLQTNSIQSGPSDHSQGFEDKNLGSSPGLQ